jgi:hypothetical protein
MRAASSCGPYCCPSLTIALSCVFVNTLCGPFSTALGSPGDDLFSSPANQALVVTGAYECDILVIPRIKFWPSPKSDVLCL